MLYPSRTRLTYLNNLPTHASARPIQQQHPGRLKIINHEKNSNLGFGLGGSKKRGLRAWEQGGMNGRGGGACSLVEFAHTVR